MKRQGRKRDDARNGSQREGRKFREENVKKEKTKIKGATREKSGKIINTSGLYAY